MTEKNKIHQIVLLDKKGLVHFSCNSLFSTEKFQSSPIAKEFPFLESIFPNLLKLEESSGPLRYSKMVNPFIELQGAFDFSFKKLSTHEGSFILWTIYDYSDLYRTIRLSQQKRNELEFYREKLEARNGRIGSIKELE